MPGTDHVEPRRLALAAERDQAEPTSLHKYASSSQCGTARSCREPEQSGLLQQDLSLEAVGVPEEYAQRPAEIVDRAVARPRVHQSLSDRVERFG